VGQWEGGVSDIWRRVDSLGRLRLGLLFRGGFDWP